jgi:exosortase A-associated hydrolase 1
MNWSDQALVFGCGDDSLLGILSAPETPATTGVVVVVGGPQYRVGSHRQFVQLARTLAGAGYAVLRFDCRGMGDSSGQQRSFDEVDADIEAAIDVLCERVPQVTRVVLWGLCDGASAALLYGQDGWDPRVRGVCLLNPWVRSDATRARTQIKHYYTKRLMQQDFWVRLLSGKVESGALRGLIENAFSVRESGKNAPDTSMPPSFQRRMASALLNLDGRILLLLSGRDLTAKEFLEYTRADPVWGCALTRPNVMRHDFPVADHTFSDTAARGMVETTTVHWLTECLRDDAR